METQKLEIIKQNKMKQNKSAYSNITYYMSHLTTLFNIIFNRNYYYSLDPVFFLTTLITT